MDIGRLLLLLSTLCFVGGFCYAFLSLKSENAAAAVRSRLTLLFMGGGFLLQSSFLYVRGQQVGSCPMTNPFELLVFLSWTVVLYYFVVGQAFRLSLLGYFSYPLVIVLQMLAIVFLPEAEKGESGFWRDLHAALSLVAYGAFAMASVAGVMFLVLHRHLKQRDLSGLFYKLPPIDQLSQAIFRLVVWGVALLTIGIASAYMMEELPGRVKLLSAYAVWALYSGILLVQIIRGMTSGRFAMTVVVAFLLPLLTLWIVSQG